MKNPLFVVLLLLVAATGWACSDECPDDESKTEAGTCGCGVPDEDGDGDAAAACVDVCPGFDDALDSDGDGTPDGCDPDRQGCERDADCDDEQDCTIETCTDGFCVTTPGEEFCPWPAERTLDGLNLSHLDNPDDPDRSSLRRNLSGAVWNPVSRTLWLARNGGPAMIWALEENPDTGELAVAENDDGRSIWGLNDGIEFGDLEAITFGRFEETHTLFVMNERASSIIELDLSEPGSAPERMVWDLTADMPAPTTYKGPEGLTFVPDRFLEAQGFRNALGERVTSRWGTGGLFFVGHQEGGVVWVFDLDRESGDYAFLGRFHTGADETAGLEFDASSGMLWIFHGGAPRTLEAARLSWSEVDGRRTFDSVTIYEAPDIPQGGSTNLEGFALTSRTDCVDGSRSAFVTTDDGGDWSLIRYREFPCR
jgi:hypothetical protein